MAALIIGLSACENTEEENPSQLAIVLEGYIYEGEPVNHIALWHMHTDGLPQKVPLRNAQVSISQSGHNVSLVEDEDRAGNYRQIGNGWVPNDETNLYLEVFSHGETLHAQVAFPPKVEGLEISNQQVVLQLFEPGEEVTRLSWNAVEGWSYCLFLRNRSPFAQHTGMQPEASSANPFYMLIEGNSISLRKEHFEYFGVYDLYVTAVQPDYAAMYQMQTGLNSAVSPSNFNTGLGMFTAFNGSAVSITVL